MAISPNPTLPLVLASSSKYRRMLLDRLCIPYLHCSPEVDETPAPQEPPEQLSRRLSQTKAKAVTATYPHHLIIGSDQVACLGGQQLGKPGTMENAVKQLQRCSGKAVMFYTSVALLNTESGALSVATDLTEVLFRTLTMAEISRYLEKERPFNCAGSFKYEGLGICLFREIKSLDPTALMGLPLIKLVSLLKNEGISIP